MRTRLLEALAVAVAALVTAGTMTPGADAAPEPLLEVSHSAHSQRLLPGATRTCYAQVESDAPGSIISQNFEPEFDAYDAEAADDFVLDRRCRRPVLYIDGWYGQGTDVADSFNV